MVRRRTMEKRTMEKRTMQRGTSLFRFYRNFILILEKGAEE